MGGAVTQKALKNFNPLFTLNYSATHKNEHNLIYVLDALEAYNQRLVKKIEVKGFEVKNFRGTDSYLYLEEIVLSSKKPPMARIELEIGYNKSINRETRLVGVGDDLYYISQEMEQYKGFTVSQIDPIARTVTFTNGEVISVSVVSGDVSEKDMRRIQIRETILSHFEKEEKLFNMGIKTLSLFFIDEVAKYRCYDENGDEVLGEYGVVFEQEYINILNDYLTLEDTPYQKYLRETCSDVTDIHKGYFSIDKKTGRSVDSQLKRGSEFSDDISAYDLILKNKERLLSFDEPTRFIFSHSALREGWDNPNVFQICTLKHSDSQTAKRQEVGRGLRLCVNQEGNRMDRETLGDTVHNVNMLTVIASESYKDFVSDLQSDIKKELYDRPSKATIPDCVQIYFSAFKILEQIRPFYNAARYFGKYISDDDKFAYGLKCDDKLVGIMVAIQLPAFFSDYTIYIDVVAIQPEYQHRGLGTKMMNSFFESVSGKSATSLNTYKNSEPYKFYQQFRFKDDEIVHMEREYIDVNELIKRLENEVANLREKNSTQPSE